MTVYRAYCTCKEPEREEIEKGLVVCLTCKNEIEVHEDAPEPDFSEAPPLVADDNEAYETRRLEDVTFDHYYR